MNKSFREKLWNGTRYFLKENDVGLNKTLPLQCRDGFIYEVYHTPKLKPKTIQKGNRDIIFIENPFISENLRITFITNHQK